MRMQEVRREKATSRSNELRETLAYTKVRSVYQSLYIQTDRDLLWGGGMAEDLIRVKTTCFDLATSSEVGKRRTLP